MSEPRATVLKIGGSVITDKSGELAAKTGEIDRLTQEIQEANVKNLIIVHGGGSFGHPAAERYAIKNGYKEEGQKIGFSETHHYMTVLNGLFMDALIWHNVPAVSITPSSCIITENGRIKTFEDASLRTLLKMNFTPVLYGDAVFDTKLGFTILSGDQLVSTLAMRFNANRIVIGVDEDGIYDTDPKTEKSAKMFERMTLQELKKLQGKTAKTTTRDVTGGMPGKIAELIPAVEKNIPVMIVNASKPRYVYKALQGETVRGTKLEKE
ncbi:MAG TPA: isopentenyl phosphate kinase [Candidatus Eisenbacteria bacterium]|nr:isopentenyl phosphate kinase [Candidatus Eisenbacteria bacterium]